MDYNITISEWELGVMDCLTRKYGYSGFEAIYNTMKNLSNVIREDFDYWRDYEISKLLDMMTPNWFSDMTRSK